ncbi:MAG: caspase domain-containing protein, partial [Rhodothermales bacterium]
MKKLIACTLISLALVPVSRAQRSLEVVPVVDVAPENNAGLFVGINEFSEDGSISALKYAVNDAVALAHLFVLELKLIPPKRAWVALSGEPSNASIRGRLEALRSAGVHIEQRATKTRLLRLIEQVRRRAREFLVLSFSSHGFEEDGFSFVVPEDGLLSRLSDTTLPLQTITQEIRASEADKRLLLLDACRNRVARGGRMTPMMSNAFQEALKSASGQATLASADIGEVAWEDEAKEHGIFTYYFIDGVRGGASADGQGLVRLGSVSRYVEDHVSDWALDEGKSQNPWFQGPERARDIPMAVKSVSRRDPVTDDPDPFTGNTPFPAREIVLQERFSDNRNDWAAKHESDRT